ncbi:predicted sulfurylase large subunit, molybdopterin cytosine dinucleotide biosynthesis /predicted sulfurylase small subunit, molybdopterin cytosine dinucleotide biosynthesis [Duganella sacchari]|uniref:Predicted sulfurylase large subunit, molybdopterin cytosine dinucleotide biosynthesis /predicted sulfurylase small subunit, molybdopterin cytosine dinucleotide biosynthesis n=1 Tax=Duganella sacchari TaxID=551987 RepID=A0A1M7JGV7_9BURK|nr:XdhC family protein [Duganella sacchari]SHM51737.1 predicted sulfurylase large subunit, molybdopterin cytosine dinucleotide biosynthesis /predicted sulfurylase small subunit, molybdopterin cytosine dinucleotide biosynthesis [Duganella sacchari]
MDSIDLEVLKTSAGWIAAGRRCELITVIKTWGSSPRPIGATLAICEDGTVIGSVSGGCIEDDLIARVRNEGIHRTTPEIVSYGITADEAHRFGLPCGGTIELSIEPLSSRSRIDELLARLERHELVQRRVDLHTGEVELSKAAPGTQLQVSEQAMVTIHGPRWRLLVIGAGQLSRFLAQIATAMDYHVIVCDPREEYRAGWHVDGVELVHDMPDDIVLAMQLDRRSAVVALTHDPKLDDLALMEALKSEAFYVGAIGSRKNNAKRRERLLEFDLTPEQLARLHGPIGLYIGSKTPSEIAISILAEMTAIKNGVPTDMIVPHAAAPTTPGDAVCVVESGAV